MVKPNKSRAVDRNGPAPEPLVRFQKFLSLCKLTHEEFLAETGFDRTRVDNWFWRDTPRVPQKDDPWLKIVALADKHHVTGLTSDWVNYGRGSEPKSQDSPSAAVSEVIEMPGKVPAGLTRKLCLEGFSPIHTHHIDIRSILLRKDSRLLEPYVQVVENRGDAMVGKIEVGDICFVDSRVNSFYGPDIYACHVGKFPLIMRIVVSATGVLRLEGTTPDKGSFDIREEEMKDLHIRGSVIHVIRKGEL